MNHAIRRQYIHLDLQGSESEGFALQNRLPELCSQELLPAMERVFDRYAPTEGYLYIERMEIDLGNIPLQQFESGLPEAVTRALEKALSEHIPPGEAHVGGDGDASMGGSAFVRLKSERQAALETFVHFLETGRLPWSFRLPPGVDLEQYLLTVWQGKTYSDPRTGGMGGTADMGIPATALAPVLRAQAARRRLVVQFSEAFLEVLLQSFSPGIHASVGRIRAALRAGSIADSRRAAVISFEKHLWETAFGQSATTHQPATGEAGLAALTATALAATPAAAPVVLSLLKSILTPVLTLFIKALRERPGVQFAAMTPHLKTLFGAASLPDMGPVAAKKDAPGGIKKFSPAPSPAPASSAGARPADTFPGLSSVPEEGVYVDNAGLVILHPFLQTFFEGLGIARDGALVHPDRALHLLHYLCTGQSPAPEYALTLPKILCNIPLEEPVELDIELTDKEKEEATALLEAAIRWWEALRNSGPDALRGTFLCRPGKLSFRDDGDWLLQVERQGFDVLLDRLPWGISVVRLPWMGGMVWVEWG